MCVRSTTLKASDIQAFSIFTALSTLRALPFYILLLSGAAMNGREMGER
jgi:hypothetical protein